MRCALAIFMIYLLTGCNSNADSNTVSSAVSVWGKVLTLEESEQGDAPALWANSDAVFAAWIDSEDDAAFQYMRVVDSNGVSAVTRLTLPPVFPFEQTLYPAAERHIHLLWLDAPYDDIAAGVRLWSAVITPDLLVELGRVEVSNQRAYHYTAIPSANQSLWVAWSGGLASEPTIYTQFMDGAGRPRLPVEAATNADFPVLLQSNGGDLHLFWLSGDLTAVFHATLDVDGTAIGSADIAPSVQLNPGDRLIRFIDGVDSTHGYLFWNIIRASGDVETWYTTGSLDMEDWTEPSRLGITVSAAIPFETGFNGGGGQTAAIGKNWIRWSAPMTAQLDILPVAVEMDGTLGILYFRGGRVVGYQHVVTLESPLLGRPSLTTDRDRHLYLAWSEQTPQGYARLNLTMTKR
jgi:hypothetical protein